MFPPFFHVPGRIILRVMDNDDSFYGAFLNALEEDMNCRGCKDCHDDCYAFDEEEYHKSKKHFSATKARKEGDIGLRNIIFDGNKTIAFWDDGTQTTSIRWSGEPDDPEKGVMAAMLKHYIGKDVCLVDEIRHWIREGKRATEKRAARKRKEKK